MLRTEALGCKLEGGWLWRGVDLGLAAGEQLALQGASGSGKTLLLRALAGLDEVQEGRIVFLGQPLEAWSAPRYRSLVGYLHQRPVLFAGSVEANLRRPFALGIHQERRFDRGAICTWLGRLGRDESFLELPAATLSGGEGQLVALMRTLQLAPQVLLLDEATASLDPDTVRGVEALVTEWLAAGERACIWTSHDTAQLARVANGFFDLGRHLGGR